MPRGSLRTAAASACRSTAPPCWRPTGAAARRPTGAKRLAALDARHRTAPPPIHYRATPSCYAQLGDSTTGASTTSSSWSTPHVSGASSSACDPALSAAAAANPRFRRAPQRGWVLTHGFNTAYSVDMIGTGTPGRAARRTTDPCSASTSIRLPCDRSISSDDRMVPGMLST